jgi:hypothetical protein
MIPSSGGPPHGPSAAPGSDTGSSRRRGEDVPFYRRILWLRSQSRQRAGQVVTGSCVGRSP